MLRFLAVLLVVVLLGFAGAYVIAGRGAPPALTVTQPERFVGQTGTLNVSATAPNAKFTALTIVLEQNGKTFPLYSLDHPEGATANAVGRDRLDITRPIGKQAVPELVSGPARIVVTATRPSFLKLRQLTSTTSKDFQVRLERPRVSVVSTHHYVNHGGSEFVVYRATPSDVLSGVRVGTVEYPGFALAGQPDLKGAFFALLWDQDLNAPIKAFARDEAGNESTATFIDNVFEKPQKKSNIQLDDKFLNRVVPEIAEHSPDLKLAPPPEGSDMLPGFLKENGELRKMNAAFIASLAKKTATNRLWDGPFVQLGNSKVEASFADHRTYFYQGKEVDRQVHLGFDLAVTEHVPVVAAAKGVVVNADWLGIYGNCVILDHGQGVQSLYGHLMSFDVKVGDTVARGQQIGRSDSTGLAGGDHLHFTMLVGGQMVNPVEWWDPHWIADRVDRKLKEAGVQ
ncbi:MAG TPA: M23 family metallopeptidase [Vicinamibacterales bacterium]|nr:M23 family metallopeptidase [Vicinamibacterales bacterium]